MKPQPQQRGWRKLGGSDTLSLSGKALNAGNTMTAREIRRLRDQKHVSILDVSARTGLPAEYIEKIESGDVVALPNDLARLKRGILEAARDKADADYEEEPPKPPLDDI